MNKEKGFTIIELIVVIAIIAVLAAIVLVNVTQYIARSKDSAIKANLATLQTNAAVYFDENSLDTGSDFVASDKGCVAGSAVRTAITNAGGTLSCNGSASTQQWCGTSALPGGGSWCVDSTGYKGALAEGKCTDTSYSCQ